MAKYCSIRAKSMDEGRQIERYFVEMLLAGRLDEVKNAIIESIERYKGLGDRFEQALCLHLLSSLYYLSGDNEIATQTMNDAIDIFKQLAESKGLNSASVVQACRGHASAVLGSIYNAIGKYDDAIRYIEEGITMLSESQDKDQSITEGIMGTRWKKDLLGQAYSDQGEIYLQTEKYDLAINRFEVALVISKDTGNKSEEARCLAYKGAAYLKKRMIDESIKNCEEGLHIFQQIGNTIGVSFCHSNLATCFGMLGQIETSDRHFQTSVEMIKDSGRFIDLSIRWGNRGITYDAISTPMFLFCGGAKEFLETCVKSFKEAINNLDKHFTTLSVDSNKTAFVDRYYSWYDRLTRPLNLLGRSAASFLFLDLGRAKVLRDLVYKQVRNEESRQPGYEASWLTIGNGEEQERIFTLCREIQLLESNATVLFYNFNHANILTIWVLHANGSVSLKTTYPTTIFLLPIENELAWYIDEVLKKVNTFCQRSYSFFKWSTNDNVVDTHCKTSCFSSEIPNDRKVKEVARGDGKGESKIGTKSEHRGGKKRADEYCDESTKSSRSHLYQVLIEPVKHFIEGTKKLIIVPQKCIFFAPFSSFIDEGGRLLSEKFQIQIIPSVHVLAESMKEAKAKKIGRSLFVGNPDLKGKFKPLDSAEEEVKVLASRLNGRLLTGGMATKSNVMDLMKDASIIHIASHGDDKTGHICLAPEWNSSNDGAHQKPSFDLLTQSDVLKCKLSARLVVLSCCFTGRGKLSSEGVLGIARAFLGAGARSVLVTLWGIDDYFTKEFMKRFYENITKGKSACAALKETMNVFQRSQHFSSFVYWSAFEIIGEDVSFTTSEIEEIRKKNEDFAVKI